MLQFLAWYLLVSLLGWLTFPLAFRLFPALADRGFSLARALGMLVWGYLFWLLASLGIIQNDGGGLLLTLAVLVGLSAWAFWTIDHRRQTTDDGSSSAVHRPSSVVNWLKSNLRLVLTIELLFFLAFAAWAFVRASNPNIETMGGEKTMELAFINAILRSPTFPPHDPWLSGYAISYYYFGYVMAAMLAKATGTIGSVAHNLMTALIFALSFIGAYGILYNLLAAWRNRHSPSSTTSPIPSGDEGVNRKSSIENRKPPLGLPLLGPLFLLFVSNLEGFLEVLHSRGLFWKFNPDGTATSSFWSWLGITNLINPPSRPLGWVPNRFIWWWQGSRVLIDLDFLGNRSEIIDEFPAFSYLLGDLHPHVLAMPFGLMAVAVALNLFLGGWKGETNLRFYRLPIQPTGLFFGGLLLGGLAFLNTWDILTGFALVVGAYVLARALANGWTWERLKDLFAFGVPAGLLAILLYLPFYVGFSSQAGGILPNLINPTRGAQLWVMFAPLFFGLLAYLVYLWRAEKRPANWKAGFGLGAGFVIFLWIVSWGLALLAYKLQPGLVASLIDSQCSGNISLCIGLTLMRRLSYIGGLLTLLGLLSMALAFWTVDRRPQTKSAELTTEDDRPQTTAHRPSSTTHPLPSLFALFLILLGTLLVLAPDFVYLRDLFSNRTNTIFKFYYQAWLLWSLAAAFGAAVMLQKLRGAWNGAYRVGLVLVIFASLAYPVFGLPAKTDDFQIPAFFQTLKAARAAGDPSALQAAAQVWTLDGAQLFQRQYPDDAAAARWLSTAPAGVVAEAVGGSYSDYARISAYSGQPAVVGWLGHEDQWRGTFEEQRRRQGNIRVLYETRSWDEAAKIIAQYNIRYVVVGTLERRDYQIDEFKFQQHLSTVFQQGEVVIYEIP